MKRIIMGLLMIVSMLTFAGCKNDQPKETIASTRLNNNVSTETSTKKTSSTKQSKESTKTTEASSTTTSTTEDQTNTLWNSEKSGQLQAFMQNWGQVMGQAYESYSPGNNVNFYGVNFPDGVIDNGGMPVAVNDQIVSNEWSENGQSSKEYAIVAAYSDAKTARYMDKHVYFFTLHNNQPVVLVSMQNQGMSDKALHFKETDNQDLKNGFASIVNGNSPNQPVQSEAKKESTSVPATWASMDEAIDFYERTYKNPENAISKNILWGNYDRKCWSLVENSGNRIVLHWANIGGAGGSYNEFIKNDDTTQLIVYGGNASYPNSPSERYTIQNTDNKVI